MNVAFVLSAVVAVAATVLMITRRNAVHALLYFVVSLLALTMCLVLSRTVDPWRLLVVVVLISFVSTLVEAVSPHGWDNATMQVVPALLGTVLL